MSARPRSQRAVTRSQLINALLRGYHRNHRRYFLEDGSREDKIARIALARMLRSDNPPQGLLWALADLFDPVNRGITWGNQREIIFKNRGGRGGQTNTLLNHRVAFHIYEAVRTGAAATVAEAQKSAEKQFGLREAGVRKIWRIGKPKMVDLFGELPPPRRGRKK